MAGEAAGRPRGEGGMSVEVQRGRAPTSSTEAPDPGSLEGQLVSLYAERARLVAELGTADADELVALVAGLRSGARPADRDPEPDASLVAQVEALYAEKETLQQQLGVSSADDLVAHVSALRERAPATTSTTETTTTETTTTQTTPEGTRTETTTESRTLTHTRTTA